tara:strand:- start:283777 stop:284529 length:753 start_codon:yes stop_codon:yes gene_type:complete
MIFTEICRELALSPAGSYASLLFSLALLAFVGSFSHCTLMCGPFVMMQIKRNQKNQTSEPATEWQRLKGSALLPYHLGRITTYSFLGGIVAYIGSQISLDWAPFTGTLLLISGVVFIAYAISSKTMNKFLNISPLANLTNMSFFKKWVRTLSTSNLSLRSYGLGIVLGFIPCAMIYIALTAAATAGGFFKGFLAMLTFGVATIPALFTLSVFGKYFTELTRIKTHIFNRIALSVAGLWLSYIAITILTTN